MMVNWTEIAELSFFVLGLALTGVYIVLIVHVWNGNRFKWVLAMASMLFVSNIGISMQGYSLF